MHAIWEIRFSIVVEHAERKAAKGWTTKEDAPQGAGLLNEFTNVNPWREICT